MLAVNNVVKRFGKFCALNGCSLDVNEGEIVGLIGPNGAGKTTLTNTISGILRCDSGTITFRGKRIHNLAPNKITQMGLSRTFQITRILRGISVMKNMMTAGLALRSDFSEISETATEILKDFRISDLANERAGNLSVGQQKLLELAMRMMQKPELLVLDEPFHGIHPELVNRIVETVAELNSEGKTFLIISHDLHSIAAVCSRVVVMNFGEVIAMGTPDEVRNNPDVIDVYLGA